jgi:hypothetical protein
VVDRPCREKVSNSRAHVTVGTRCDNPMTDQIARVGSNLVRGAPKQLGSTGLEGMHGQS